MTAIPAGGGPLERAKIVSLDGSRTAHLLEHPHAGVAQWRKAFEQRFHLLDTANAIKTIQHRADIFVVYRAHIRQSEKGAGLRRGAVHVNGNLHVPALSG